MVQAASTASLAGRARHLERSVPEPLREREHGKPVVVTAEEQWEEF
ncbi:hypothetical protein ACE0DR_05395 [Azotobacter sp. CWF10]